MKYLVSLFLAFWTTTAVVEAQAQDFSAAAFSQGSAVVVTGFAVVNREPDFAVVRATIGGNGVTRQQALAEMAKAQARIEAGLARIEGATSTVEADELTVNEIIEPDCAGNHGAPVMPQVYCGKSKSAGFASSVALKVKVRPPKRISDCISSLIELGALNAQLESVDIDDRSTVENEMLVAAINNARIKANIIAATTGRRLGGAKLVVNAGDQRSNIYEDRAVKVDLPLPGLQTVPQTRLSLTIPKVRVSSSVLVSFAWAD